MLTRPERLGAVAQVIADSRNEFFLSAASSWEIAIKYSLGRLPLPIPPASYVPSRIRSTGVTPLAIEHSHTLDVAELPPHHRDPFDRLLVAQARSLDLPLVTADPVFAAYDVTTIEVR